MIPRRETSLVRVTSASCEIATYFLAVALIYAEYFDASKDALIKKFLDASIANLEQDAIANGIYYPWVFLNDAGIDQDPISTYGYGRSREKLVGIAHEFDPLGVFQKNVPGYKLVGEMHAC